MEPSDTRGPRRWLPLRLAVVALVLVVAFAVALLARGGDADPGAAPAGGPTRTATPSPTAPVDDATGTPAAGAAQAVVVDSYRGLPDGADAPEPPEDLDPGWIVEDGHLAVYAPGSSTCPWLPTTVTVTGDDVVVRMESDGEICTADLVWTTSVLELPDGTDPATVRVDVVLDR